MSTGAMLRMTAPMREDFEVPYHDLGDPQQSPRVALVAGLHGDEVNGVFVLSRLAAYLRKVERGDADGQRLQGRVIVIPAVNVLGLNTRTRAWPFDKTDINRMFPGYDAGETTQRIAHAVLEITRSAAYRVDIHSSNRDFEELPQVQLYEPRRNERASAFLFGLPAIVVRRSTSLYTSTIGHAWQNLGGENFVVQAGHAGGLQLSHCERLFRSLISFLRRTGTISGVDLSEEDEETHFFDLRQGLPLISENAGIFVSNLEVGRWLQAGDTIGFIYNGLEGEIHAEIKTPVAGLLTGIRRQPLLCQGDLIARIHSREENTGVQNTAPQI